jgi:hypothetical protein
MNTQESIHDISNSTELNVLLLICQKLLWEIFLRLGAIERFPFLTYCFLLSWTLVQIPFILKRFDWLTSNQGEVQRW